MVTLEGLEFSYPSGNFRISVPDWQVTDGARVAIVGPSGSGKTTLLHLVSGILVPHRGRIQVAGFPISELSDSKRRQFRARHIGFVFQDFELVEYLNVRENILYPFYLHPFLAEQKPSQKEVDGLLEQLGIAGKGNRPISQLSQGEKQRVAIARALSINPPLILADEPTGSLDPANKTGILQLLFEFCLRTKATLLMVTHDHSLLEGFDRVQAFDDWRSDAKDL